MPQFSIPNAATSLVEVPESQLDLRPDSEILAELAVFRPIESEKNVW
jgi:hypothetical protein